MDERIDAPAAGEVSAAQTIDPAVAEDIKNLSESRLTLDSFQEYMKLRDQEERRQRGTRDLHRAKVLAKRRAADKAAKKARRRNRGR